MGGRRRRGRVGGKSVWRKRRRRRRRRKWRRRRRKENKKKLCQGAGAGACWHLWVAPQTASKGTGGAAPALLRDAGAKSRLAPPEIGASVGRSHPRKLLPLRGARAARLDSFGDGTPRGPCRAKHRVKVRQARSKPALVCGQAGHCGIGGRACDITHCAPHDREREKRTREEDV